MFPLQVSVDKHYVGQPLQGLHDEEKKELLTQAISSLRDENIPLDVFRAIGKQASVLKNRANVCNPRFHLLIIKWGCIKQINVTCLLYIYILHTYGFKIEHTFTSD